MRTPISFVSNKSRETGPPSIRPRLTASSVIKSSSAEDKTKIEFSTIDKLRLSQLEQIQQWIAGARLNTKERKVKVEYWDDELLQYRVMNAAYQTDTTYPVSSVSRVRNTIKYRQIKFTFIEY